MPSAKELAKALARQDSVTQQPRDRFLGATSDAFKFLSDQADRYVVPERDPLLAGMRGGDLLPFGNVARLLDDLSHGGRITTGRGQTTALRPEVVDTVALGGMLANPVKLAGIAALKNAAKQIHTGTGVLGRNVMNPRMNMFAGEGAKTADHGALKVAKDMQAAGVPDEAIHAKTKWTFGFADGKPRFEIDDSAAKGQFTHLDAENEKRVAYQALVHPSAYKEYPELSKLSQYGFKAGKETGSFDPSHTDGKFTGNGLLIANAPNEAGIKSVGLHELQHAIQQREGFASGGSPSDFKTKAIPSRLKDVAFGRDMREMAISQRLSKEGLPIADGKYHNLNDPKIMGKARALAESDPVLANYLDEYISQSAQLEKYPTAHQQYRRLAGEAEARLTQARMNMTAPERAASYPPSMFDVPVKDQIVRYGDNVGGAMMQRPKPAGLLDYQIEHKPMTIEGGAAPLHDLSKSFGEDVYGKNALQYYGSGDARESGTLRLLQSLRGKPDAQVTIYRGAPSEAGGINAGDWVTLDKRVAQDYVDQALASDGKAGKVFSQKVPASHITSWPDSLMEFGYHPPAKSVPKTQYELAHEVAQRNAALPVEQGGMLDNVGGAMMQRPKTEFEILHDTAQRNAALPKEQGGLGLPSGNTAMDRAGAMGFDTPAYHGTNADIKEFDLSKHGTSTDKGDFGKAVYVSTDNAIANNYANAKDMYGKDISGANVMPLSIKENNAYPVNGQQGMAELIKKLGGEDAWYDLQQNPDKYANAIKDLGYDSVRDYGYKQSAVFNPANIRSRFAAFDPMRRHEADILAGVGVGGMLDPQAIAEALRQQDRK